MSRFVKINYDEERKKEFSDFESDVPDKASLVSLKLGTNKIRFIPPTDVCPKLCHHVDIHWIFLNGKRFPVLCLGMNGDPCPICEDSSAHYKIGDKVSGYNKKAKPQYLYNVMTEDGKIGVLPLDKRVAELLDKKHSSIQEELENPFDYWDADRGIWMLIIKTQKKTDKPPPFDKENCFDIVASQKNKCPITPDMEDAMLAGVKDLTKMYKKYSYEELSKMYYGTENEDSSTSASGAENNTSSDATPPADPPPSVGGGADDFDPPSLTAECASKSAVNEDEVNAFLSKLKL